MGKQYYMWHVRRLKGRDAVARDVRRARQRFNVCLLFRGLDAPGACGCAIRCARWALAVRAFFTSWATPASTLAWPPARTCAVDYTRAPDMARDTHSIVGTVR
jgi:hypothetical protein